jgi:hypothetical protein
VIKNQTDKGGKGIKKTETQKRQNFTILTKVQKTHAKG